ncbi:unnamed protein product [Amoebophrya sp. A25]|nr:unnamed protein product [Amoebophrya sp. A25]|eukprot:GSA25T00005872001.1
MLLSSVAQIQVNPSHRLYRKCGSYVNERAQFNVQPRALPLFAELWRSENATDALEEKRHVLRVLRLAGPRAFDAFRRRHVLQQLLSSCSSDALTDFATWADVLSVLQNWAHAARSGTGAVSPDRVRSVIQEIGLFSWMRGEARAERWSGNAKLQRVSLVKLAQLLLAVTEAVVVADVADAEPTESCGDARTAGPPTPMSKSEDATVRCRRRLVLQEELRAVMLDLRTRLKNDVGHVLAESEVRRNTEILRRVEVLTSI